MSPHEGEALLAARRMLIERVATSVGHHYRLSPDRTRALAELFAERLRDDQFALLRTLPKAPLVQFLLRVAKSELGPVEEHGTEAFAEAVAPSMIIVHVTLADVVMGWSIIVQRPRIVRALFFPAAGYAAIASHAREFAVAVALLDGESFADEMQRVHSYWTGGPLAVQDALGRPIRANGVFVGEGPGRPGKVATCIVYIDLRLDEGPVWARKPTKPLSPVEWKQAPGR